MKVSKNSRSIVLALLCLSLLSSINLVAGEPVRDILIAWYDQDNKLTVKKDGVPIDESYLYHFELRKDDKVILYMEALWGETKKLQIEYIPNQRPQTPSHNHIEQSQWAQKNAKNCRN